MYKRAPKSFNHCETERDKKCTHCGNNVSKCVALDNSSVWQTIHSHLPDLSSHSSVTQFGLARKHREEKLLNIKAQNKIKAKFGTKMKQGKGRSLGNHFFAWKDFQWHKEKILLNGRQLVIVPKCVSPLVRIRTLSQTSLHLGTPLARADRIKEVNREGWDANRRKEGAREGSGWSI